MNRREALGATSAAALAAALPGVAIAAEAEPTYRNARLPVASRVQDLLARMTLEEKAAQLCCMWESKRSFQDEHGEFSSDRAATALKNGIGQIARPGDIRGFSEWGDHPFRSIAATVRQVNQIQRFLVERTRLGIPALFHDELAHGLLAGEATIFPIAPALASTWDPDLVEQVYTVAAREARARGTTLALTPVLTEAGGFAWTLRAGADARRRSGEDIVASLAGSPVSFAGGANGDSLGGFVGANLDYRLGAATLSSDLELGLDTAGLHSIAARATLAGGF